MNMRRTHVWISGRVHGVFFRAFTQDTAQMAGVRGWVRNLPDGRVEAVFEGENNKVAEMIAWCHEGSPSSRVDGVEVRDETYTGEFQSFSIKY
ncbi:MAG: acylphosphatase [Desulfobacteraceae bacterium]|nr:acylphosphatase [Desulfobacteraceae bacterium]